VNLKMDTQEKEIDTVQVLTTFKAVEEKHKQRYLNLMRRFRERFGEMPKFYSRAPGRVNIIGEHIDYCGYSVLPAAIE